MVTAESGRSGTRRVLVSVGVFFLAVSFLALSPKLPEAGLLRADIDADAALLSLLALVIAALLALAGCVQQAVSELRIGPSALLLTACVARYVSLAPFVW